MAGINIQLIAAELQRLVVQNKIATPADFALATTTTVDKYCRKVTKVKGTYQVLHSIMTHVVQGFKAEWNELGELAVIDKELKNYKQKVNFGFVPADVLSTALADWYEEGKKPTDQEIAKFIAKWILEKVADDVELLSQIGEYDAALAAGTFGKSMNGWNKIIELALANTTNPVYKIPLNAITDANISDELLKFERGFPKIFKKKIKHIFMSENNAERYVVAYKEKYKDSPNYKEGDTLKSPLGKREIVILPSIDDDKIWATVDGNMLNLIDVIDNPTNFTDVQVADYKVKMFLELSKGYDFLINQAVCVADFTGDVKGLGNEAQMAKYYPHEV